ncbi:MAG: pantoate--beta-alanine ligase [Alphaproteobacteria bacterium]|nr:pantoate--beta-alanine ligase [Alphaproteobacteria bacterium]
MMVSESIASLRGHFTENSGKKRGFIPTMGALHDGHMSLVEQARRHGADYLIASIFVNPTQFAPHEDFSKYPRSLEADLAKLAAAGVHEVFVPQAHDIYRDGFATEVTIRGLSEQLCGPFRPGHFAGVATVVLKLFTLVKPHVAVFGEKDFQQLQIIRRMVSDLELGIEIIGVPTLRESSGLAQSSRNRYLVENERAAAAQIYATLLATRQDLLQLPTGTDSVEKIGEILNQGKAKLTAAGFMKIDYLAWVWNDSLLPVTAKPQKTQATRLAVAAFLGHIRLIDNIAV